MKTNLNIIVVTDSTGGFGYNREIPWWNESFMDADKKRFQKATKGNVCIMGRITAEEIADMNSKRKRKPTSLLEGRDSIVISSNKDLKIEGAKVYPSLSQAAEDYKTRDIWVLGGYKMFVEALPFTKTISMTIIKDHHAFPADRTFPLQYVDKNFTIHSGEETDDLWFVQYRRK